ncbi:unnamed protein product, partial [Oncorhynchus mykiss]
CVCVCVCEGLCRTCEIFGASALVLDSLRHVSDKHFQALSVSSELWLPLLEVKPVELADFLQLKKREGYCIVGDLCLYVGYTSSVYCTASVLTLAAIALDRYHSIMDCLRYSSHCTLWRKCAVVLWIWLQALVTSCPPLLGWSTVSYMAPMYRLVCAVNWKSSPSYTAFMAALSFLMPAAVILFCYVIIVRVARSHARRIHNLEDQLQRNTGMPSSSFPTESAHGPSTSRLVYHMSGRFTSNHPDSTSSSNAASRRLFSFLAQHAPHGHPHPPHQNSNSNHLHHHGVVRLFLVIAAFFLCWTPYIGIALVQATETALSCKSSLVPPSAVTFSYWLVLLNSDINPLLYALLSQRFQGALRCLKQKIRVRLGGNVVGKGLRRAYCSSVFTVDSNFSDSSRERVCGVFRPGSSASSSTSSCPPWQDSVGGGGERSSNRRLECLQVPTRTAEGSSLPFSAATRDRQATFFYGQITVRVEHDVC